MMVLMMHIVHSDQVLRCPNKFVSTCMVLAGHERTNTRRGSSSRSARTCRNWISLWHTLIANHNSFSSGLLKKIV